jgi:peptidoglycan/xylan/chitin deacetylase (PgdA/CDA1 family)
MKISSLYRSQDPNLLRKIRDGVREQIRDAMAGNGIKVFFRADDIAVPSKNFSTMMNLFLSYRIPLCLAVVPAWMTPKRWEAMAEFRKNGQDLFCWHMHGYRHMNHETLGKKQEFGPARTARALLDDLTKGQERLQTIMGKDLTPVFTPPWNRCGMDALIVLKKAGFAAVSRSRGSLPVAPEGLQDIPVHVDLHTRKETSAEDARDKLLEEFRTGLASPVCGIMLHHMCMNDAAFLLLEYLLELFSGYGQIRKITYKDLIS